MNAVPFEERLVEKSEKLCNNRRERRRTKFRPFRNRKNYPTIITQIGPFAFYKSHPRKQVIDCGNGKFKTIIHTV
ncbi:hypothetical protein [Leeuwenhoekiella sp. LLG6367-2.1]|uniref:hypothetical protein n=1 Tax=Leeuwenhoekiella sp. LLG6367-2.1 TaxID=3160833 RepID=UPI003867DB42